MFFPAHFSLNLTFHSFKKIFFLIFREVKAEIRDEYECLKPCANGRFELFLLSDNGCGRMIQRPIDQKHHHHGFAQRQVLAPSHFQVLLLNNLVKIQRKIDEEPKNYFR